LPQPAGFFFAFFFFGLAGGGLLGSDVAAAGVGAAAGAGGGAGSGVAAGSGAAVAAVSAAAGSPAGASAGASVEAELGSAGGGVSLEPPPQAAMAVAMTSGANSTMDFRVGMTRNLRGRLVMGTDKNFKQNPRGWSSDHPERGGCEGPHASLGKPEKDRLSSWNSYDYRLLPRRSGAGAGESAADTIAL
jgi:hypothetical protein